MRGGSRTGRLVMGYGLSSSFAGSVVSPFYSVFLFELARGSFLQTGLASQVPLAVSVLMGYVWARLSDRSSRRRVFVQLSAATGVVVSLALSYMESVEQLLVVQVARALLGSAGGAAFSALVAESFREGPSSRSFRRAARRLPEGFWKLFAARLLMTLPGAISSGVFAMHYLKYLGGSPES